MQNIIDEFKNAMLECGVTPPDHIICDGLLHRFKIDGKLNGAYVLHVDEQPAGFFQDFKQGIKSTWRGKKEPMTKSQRMAAVRKRRDAEIKRQAEIDVKHTEAAIRARHIWNQSSYATSKHPYLVRKNILAHGLKIGFGNTLIVPIWNPFGEVVNLQFIAPDGVKRFLPGGQKKGCFCTLGEVTDKILICEGFATGASLFEETGCLTVIAFDAGNLTPVAVAVRGLSSDAEIVIAGDNDESGVGQKYANEAALACGGSVLIPPRLGCDWNDYLQLLKVESEQS